MELRQAKLEIIDAIPGGWDVAAAFLGITVNALRNRVYEVKDQKLSDEKTLALQQLSKTTHYADAIARSSGGVFVQLPDAECENQDLMRKFNELYAELGLFSRHFTEATADEKIDRSEKAMLEEDAARMHKALGELLALMLKIYTPRAPGEAV